MSLFCLLRSTLSEFHVVRMIPELRIKLPTYNFCVELTKALSAQRPTVLDNQNDFPIIFADKSVTQEERLAIFDEIVDKFLDLAIAPLREIVLLETHAEVSRARVIQIVELCITTGRLEACREFLQHILSFPWAPDAATQKMFATLVIPVIRDLRPLLQQYTIPIWSPPFSYFLGVLIMRYTNFILGRQPTEDVTPYLTIGCGCIKCVQLLQFLTSADHDEFHVLADKSVLDHMEERLATVPERIVTRLTVIPGRHMLKVYKKPSALRQEWNNRRDDANSFLSLIGGRGTIRKIFSGQPDEAIEMLLKSDLQESSHPVIIDLG